MNEKPLPVMYSTLFWCLLVLFLFFLALFHNHCYSLQQMKSEAGHFYLAAGSWTGRNKNAVFRRNSKQLQLFSAPIEEGNLFFLSGR